MYEDFVELDSIKWMILYLQTQNKITQVIAL